MAAAQAAAAAAAAASSSSSSREYKKEKRKRKKHKKEKKEKKQQQSSGGSSSEDETVVVRSKRSRPDGDAAARRDEERAKERDERDEEERKEREMDADLEARDAFVERAWSSIFYFARLRPRLLFVIGSALRALQTTTVLQYVFDPTAGVGFGLNVLALLTSSRWPATFLLGWASSSGLWRLLGAKPPPASSCIWCKWWFFG